jgi:hypothetical protein
MRIGRHPFGYRDTPLGYRDILLQHVMQYVAQKHYTYVLAVLATSLQYLNIESCGIY